MSARTQVRRRDVRSPARAVAVLCGDVSTATGAVPADEAREPMWVADAWTAERLSRTERDLLAGLPPLAELDVEGAGRVLFCHGTPRSDEERVTAVTRRPAL